MDRREFAKTAGKGLLVTGAVSVSGAELLFTEGCLTQDTLAALASTLGGAAASVASMLGESALATEITTYAAQVAAAIAAWTAGTPAQNISAAITLLEGALESPELSGLPYVGLIDIALSAIQGILAWVTKKSPALAATLKTKTIRVLSYTGKPPQDARTFKSVWNAQAALDSRTVALEIK